VGVVRRIKVPECKEGSRVTWSIPTEAGPSSYVINQCWKNFQTTMRKKGGTDLFKRGEGGPVRKPRMEGVAYSSKVPEGKGPAWICRS